MPSVWWRLWQQPGRASHIAHCFVLLPCHFTASSAPGAWSHSYSYRNHMVMIMVITYSCYLSFSIFVSGHKFPIVSTADALFLDIDLIRNSWPNPGHSGHTASLTHLQSCEDCLMLYLVTSRSFELSSLSFYLVGFTIWWSPSVFYPRWPLPEWVVK